MVELEIFVGGPNYDTEKPVKRNSKNIYTKP